MSYVKGDRVRMVNNPAQLGTVTGERDQMFLSFVGVQWDGLDFAFVPPSNIEPDTPNGSPNATIDACQNHTENGMDVTDWQARAEQAEREASEWARSFNAERADKYMAEDAAKSWRLAAERAGAMVAAVRELHKPKRITEYNVPVFDEYDSPTVTRNGCACGSHYHPCPTTRAILDAALDADQ